MKRERQNSQFQKALSLTLIYSLVAPSFIRADGDEPSSSTKSSIMQLGSMNQASAALQNLNKAMETAAQNPNDDWRREEVRKAVQAVPGAVQAVASTFAAHTMGNSALPFVLSTLGSAIDVNAPNSFDKHLKNPEAIQKSGEAASESKRPSEDFYIVVKEEARGFEIPVVKAGTQASTQVFSDSSDIAQVSFAPVSNFTSNINFTPVSKETSSAPSLEQKVLAPSSEVISSLHEDLAVAEAALRQKEEIKSRELSSIEEPEFSFEKPSKKDLKERRQKRAPSLKPTSWLLAPVFYLASLENEAHAEAPGSGVPNGNPSNPGNQSGAGAGGILFGIAAIIGAVSPMVAASIQSQQEQNVATIQAQAQIQQAEIQTSTQKEMAQLSSQTAMAQAKAQQDVAKMNNDAQTERLQINLAAQQQVRNEQRQAEVEQMTLERQLSAQKVALAMQKADEQILMVRQNNEAVKMQQALSGTSSQNLQAGNAATSSRVSGGNPLAAALAAQAVTESAAQTNSAEAATGLRNTSVTARGLVAPANRLLASADDGVFSEAENIPAVRSALGRARGLRSRGRLGSTRRSLLNSARGFYKSGLSMTAAGSFSEGRALRQRDLTRFVNEVEPNQNDAEVFEARRSIRRSQGPGSH